jgi:protein-export membrane protein SecD
MIKILSSVGLVLAFIGHTCGCERSKTFRGGTRLTYQLDMSERAEDERSIAEDVRTTLLNRFEVAGRSEPRIAVEGKDRLVIDVEASPGSADLESAKRLIEPVGKLEFCLVAPDADQSPARIQEIQAEEKGHTEALRAWWKARREHEAMRKTQGKTPEFREPMPEPPTFIAREEKESQDRNGRRVQVSKGIKVLRNGEEYKVSGRYVRNASKTLDLSGKPAVSFSFDREGATCFAELTGSNVGRFLAILVDEDIVSVARIQSQISDEGQLTGNFTRDEVRALAAVLRGGSLPGRPLLISEAPVGEDGGPPGR